jgi:RHS repeat-associated protein
VTIDYDYDPLSRLTGAIYSSGEVYTYTYDKVGNRSSQISPEFNTSYEYDNANRLIQVDGIDYTWDDNGNLLSDGVYTYTYDYENRLIAVSDQQSAFSFAYNGLGDRYQQTADGETVTYTLYIVSDLSQVLMDGNNTYLYCLGRIAQENESRTDYFLPDALGSVRQLTTQDGNIGLTQSFDPFGNPLYTMGPGASSYGYAGEWADASGLQFLRARYYALEQGRFLSHDPFPGLLGQPATLDPYMYTLHNSVIYNAPIDNNLY